MGKNILHKLAKKTLPLQGHVSYTVQEAVFSTLAQL